MSYSGRERIEKYLYRQLMVLGEGQKLPPVRTIMQECGVSQAPVQGILKKYEADGIIKSSARKGYYKAEEKKAGVTFEELDLIYCTTAKNEDPLMKFHGNFSHLLGSMCGESWRSVRIHYLEGDAGTERIEQLARNSRCRACIIIASPNCEISKVLQNHHVAYVNLFPGSLRLDEDAVNILIDNDEVIRTQLDFLIRLGHRRIAYLHNIRENEWIRDLCMRREAFLRQSLIYGLPLQPEWIQFGGYDSDTCRAAMKRILAAKERPTAVIAHDHHLPAIYQELNEHGITPGKEFSILGTDNLSIAQIVTPQASSLEISQQKAAAAAVDALEKTIRGEYCDKQIFIPLQIIERQSTQAVEKQIAGAS